MMKIQKEVQIGGSKMQIRKKQKRDKLFLEKIFCNKCGKEIKMLYHRPAEGVCTVKQIWEYGAEQDGEKHRFDLCELCYGEMIENFVIPVTVETKGIS